MDKDYKALLDDLAFARGRAEVLEAENARLRADNVLLRNMMEFYKIEAWERR